MSAYGRTPVLVGERSTLSITAPFVKAPAAASVLRLVCDYDCFRLRAYRKGESLGDQIKVRSFGGATALRYDEVGYFNRVYCPDAASLDRLTEIEDFYADCRYGCELIGPPSDPLNYRLLTPPSRAWIPGDKYAWLAAKTSALRPGGVPGDFTIRAPGPEEQRRFLTTYLRAYGADPERFSAAILNMRHLFDEPSLSFLMAWEEGHPAGVAMLRRTGNTALLCAGAALSETAGEACYGALLSAMINLARVARLENVCGWGIAGGQRQKSMEDVGLATVGMTQSWRLRPVIKR
jgi:hypothetical protein